MWITIFIVIFWSICVVAWLLRRKRRNAATTSIENLTEVGAKHKIHGHPVACNEMLVAPLSGRECVYFEARAVQISGGERILARKHSKTDFYINDGTGQVLIPRGEIRHLDIPQDVVVYSTPEDVFQRLGAARPEGTLNNMIVYERIIPPSPPISVLGVVATSSTSDGLQLENSEIFGQRESTSVELS